MRCGQASIFAGDGLRVAKHHSANRERNECDHVAKFGRHAPFVFAASARCPSKHRRALPITRARSLNLDAIKSFVVTEEVATGDRRPHRLRAEFYECSRRDEFASKSGGAFAKLYQWSITAWSASLDWPGRRCWPGDHAGQPGNFCARRSLSDRSTPTSHIRQDGDFAPI